MVMLDSKRLLDVTVTRKSCILHRKLRVLMTNIWLVYTHVVVLMRVNFTIILSDDPRMPHIKRAT